MPTFTLREAVARGAEFLAQKGITTARLDAELLVGLAVGMDRLRVFLNLDRPLDDNERTKARELLVRRSRFEPVALILGRREFYGRDFEVTRDTLIPRPETELLIDLVAELLAEQPAESAEDEAHAAEGIPAEHQAILEVGVGTGCIAITLAAENPTWRLIGTELSAATAEVAHRNVAKHGVQDRVEVRVQNSLDGLAPNQFDLLVSNPPYIANHERDGLPADVRDYEPASALFAGDDGLDVVRMILTEGHPLVKPGAPLVMEIGHQQADAVAALATESGWQVLPFRKDYAGINRFAVLRRPPGV